MWDEMLLGGIKCYHERQGYRVGSNVTMWDEMFKYPNVGGPQISSANLGTYC